MKYLIILFSAIVLFHLTSCNKEEKVDEGKMIWKGDSGLVLTDEEIQGEISEKMERLNKFFSDNNIAGMLFTQVRNVNWITGGRANTQIVLNKDAGAASLLVMKDGSKYLICNDAEAGRLMEGGLNKLGYQLKKYNWYESNPAKDVRGEIIKEIAGDRIIGSDVPFPGTTLMSDQFKPLRFSFTNAELKRYKWLGEQCTEAVSEICRRVKPGMDEFEIEAMAAAELRSRGILPTVLLMGVDDRIYKYRHALPGGKKLEKYAMINIVAEKWGMPIAVTRFVHFGPLPSELADKLKKTAIVNAYYEEATKPGVTSKEIWEKCKSWYAQVGYEGEWMKHHQGGSIGYDDREYVIYPNVEGIIQENQPFAWNPTITGAKVEETIIAKSDGAEVITKSKDWPMIVVNLNGKKYPQPGILIRDADNGEIIKQEEIQINP